ncbi:phosphatidylinositide phosphatase SAC1-like, partial [Planoprotostelium fungivorum]
MAPTHLTLFIDDKNVVISNNSEYLEEDVIIQREAPYKVTKGRSPTTTLPIHKKGEIMAVLGLLNLLRGPYLLVVTAASHAGEIEYPAGNRHEVHLITDVDVISLNDSSSMSREQLADEAQYRQMLVHLLTSQSFYFSYTYDLTNSLQRNESPIGKTKPDKRFVWNDAALQPFSSVHKEWITPIIQGYFSSTPNCSVTPTGGQVRAEWPVVDLPPQLRKGKNSDATFTFTVLSRRSKDRVGTRYHSRGADE